MKRYDVIAIGELNADIILTGLSGLPEPGRERIAGGFSVEMGSSTAISACGMARLGLRTAFAGKVGADDFGRLARRTLESYGVDTEHIVASEDIKTGVTVSLSTPSDRALATYLGSIEALEAEDIDLSLLDRTRHIHVGSFFLQSKLRKGLPGLFAAARQRKVTTSLDTGWDDSGSWDQGLWDTLGYTDVFLPNETEALHITGCGKVEEALEKLSRICPVTAVKLGPKGALAMAGSEKAFRKTYPLKPVDTTGAGDSFNAGFIYGYLMGRTLEKCLEYGNACGSLSVRRVGGASSCASLEEVQALMEKGEP